MYDRPVSENYKEYANKIVGTWYNRIPDEILTFSFLDDVKDEAELLTQVNGEFTKASYNIIVTYEKQWYLQIWSTAGKKNGVYRIEILTPSMLTVSTNENKIATYQRKVDYSFANQLIKNYLF